MTVLLPIREPAHAFEPCYKSVPMDPSAARPRSRPCHRVQISVKLHFIPIKRNPLAGGLTAAALVRGTRGSGVVKPETLIGSASIGRRYKRSNSL